MEQIKLDLNSNILNYNPSVSVVIPTSNRDELKKTLSSLRNQSFRDFEILIVSKKMDERLKKLAHDYDAQVLEDNGRGRCYARNLGAKKARGKVIAFIDDDVELERNWLEVVMKNFRSSQIGGVGGVPEGTRNLSDSVTYSIFLKPIIFLFQLRQIHCWNMYSEHKVSIDFLSGTNMAFSKEAVLRAGGFDENFYEPADSEDLDFCLRVRDMGYYLILDPSARARHNCDYLQRVLVHRKDPNYFLSVADNSAYCRAKNKVYKNVGWCVFFLHEILNAVLLSNVSANKLVFFSYLRGVFKGYVRGKSVKAKSVDERR